MKKTTLYIDVDDDIAAIIDKVSSADEKIVAMVLPKRPSVLQGSVNLQLLKKSAEDFGKSLVLITTDEQVIRLAGQASLYVSGSLQSKPYVPQSDDSDESAIEELSDSDTTRVPLAAALATAAAVDPAQPDVYADGEKVDLSTPVGELSGDMDDEIELDNSDIGDDIDAIDADKAKKADSSKSKSKKIKVPNFDKFRTKLLLGGLGVVLLLVGLYWAFAIAPKATVVISTEKTEQQAKITVTASESTKTVDATKMLVPATKKTDKQKLTGTFTATGQKDVGERARGTVTFRNCEDSSPITIPSGTGVSKGSYTFITQQAVELEGGTFSGGGTVCTSDSSEAVDVVASQPGDQYNLAAGSYGVAGFGNVQASGSAMGGGTTKIVKIVTAEDIEAAKIKVLETGADNVQGKLTQLLKSDGLVPIQETYTSTNGEAVSSVPVGSEATTDPTLTVEVTSTMLGMKTSDVEPLIRAELEKSIDPTKQKIYSTGIESATIAVIEKPDPSTVKLTIASTGSIGPNLDSAKVASDIAGKKAGEAKQYLEALPGVSKADIQLSPFWVFSLPKKTSSINVSINE